jgi:hypothetical protein
MKIQTLVCQLFMFIKNSIIVYSPTSIH